MQKTISFQVTAEEASNDEALKSYIASTAATQPEEITGYTILKRSIDARSKIARVNFKMLVFIGEPCLRRPTERFTYPDISNSPQTVHIIGAGPAGLFAALQLIERGIKPIIVERGKDVRARRRDLALLNKNGILNPESNYCFGEGGAGTYSDGKLYTRSNKRGNIDKILQVFVQFGAPEKILYESHPHIGTNRLPAIIADIRTQILNSGGEIRFESKLTGLTIQNNRIRSIEINAAENHPVESLILATGHSARDIFTLLFDTGIKIESKPFALGVRVEHPQGLIDEIQYHSPDRSIHLPPASYRLVEQVNEKGVFSFCMCPGGIIAPAATADNEVVVNGWSPSKRNNPFANSGMVVTVSEEDIRPYKNASPELEKYYQTPLGLMYFQQFVERSAFWAGGGKFVAPAQRMVDFSLGKLSDTLPICSYIPGVKSVELENVLPAVVNEALQKGFRAFGNKMKGFFTNEAIVVATESRTSSPVRIPRNEDNLQHPQISNLFPCGEGAGYAGGIVSAAMDGEKVANMIADQILRQLRP